MISLKNFFLVFLVIFCIVNIDVFSASIKDKQKPTKKQKVVSKQSLPKLKQEITNLLNKPEFIDAGVSVRIITQATGKVVFEKEAEKLLKPASNMKIYTTAVALEALSPNYRIRTSVYSENKPDNDGVIKGNLILYGRGDPTFASSYMDDYQPFDLLVKQLSGAGVKQINGDLIADESYLKGSSLGQGWEWLDLQWHFGAEISALTAYDNKVEVQIKPGAKIGDPCQITVTPDVGYVSIINKMDTIAAKGQREIGLNRGLADNSLLAWGKMPLDDTGFSARLAVYRPAGMFASLFKAALSRSNIKFNGKIIIIDSSLRSPLTPSNTEKLVELAAIDSPPLSEIIRIVNKFSQNLYAELLLRTIGKVKGKVEKDSDEAGLEVIKDFLSQIKVDPTKLLLSDGSGLSRRNLINAFVTTELLKYISRSANFAVFQDSLPLASVDGTLRRRMADSKAAQNVQAKTGTLSNTSSLSGYVKSAGGETFIFSILVDNFTADFRQALALQDKICQYLADFTGKIEAIN